MLLGEFVYIALLISVVVFGLIFAIQRSLQGFNGQTFFRVDKAEKLIKSWAANYNYDIMSMEPALSGSFLETTSEYQTVYYVTLSTDSGRRKAFIRCGDPVAGLLLNSIEVEWDD